MSESPFVRTIVDFFRDGFLTKAEWSLVELLWYFDCKQKTPPSTDEINRAIEVYKNLSVKRVGGEVYFIKADRAGAATGDVTEAELKRAAKRYRKEFWKTYRQLTRDA
jgi:hypothetical protein